MIKPTGTHVAALKRREILEIDSGIPSPKPRAKRGIYERTLRIMRPGDSIVIRHYGRIFEIAEKLGFEITTQRVGPTELRVWRVR